jgi:hypothetical protein
MKLPAICATVLLGVSGVYADDPAQKTDIRELATAYAGTLIDGLANVVAEEQYTQESSRPRRTRTLTSDFLVVRYPGSANWHVFRDVFEVDGKLVRERDKRLVKLLQGPPETSLFRAQEIANASMQYNVMEIGTVNNPLMVIAFMQRKYRDHFRLSPGGIERKLGPTIRSVRFEEVVRPTILKWGGNVDLPAEGRLWVDEQTGRIVKTELKLAERDNLRSDVVWRPATVITTLFGHDDTLDIDVPIEMRDHYPMDRNDIRGVAKYDRFWRFRAGEVSLR